MPVYVAVAGGPRKELEMEEGQTLKEILANAGIERQEGEIFVVATEEVFDDFVPKEGQSIYYVAPVDLG